VSDLLTVAAIDLARRESPRIVAATGLIFSELASLVSKVEQLDKLTSVRGGTWGEEAVPGCGYPVLRSTNMRGTHVDVADAAWREVPYKQAESCSLQNGDILITKSSGSSDLVGKAALFNHPGDNQIYLFSNFVLRLRPHADIVLPEYLAWFLRSPQSLMWRYDTQQNAVGLRNLQTKEFLGQQVPIPNKELQKAIVTYFDFVEDDAGAAMKVNLPSSLTKQRRIVARIEELAAKIEEARGLRRRAMREADDLMVVARAKVFAQALKGETQRLEDVASLERGKFSHRPRNDPHFFGGDHAWIQIAEIESSHKYIYRWTETLNDTGLAISRKFPAGTLLISIAATIGAVGVNSSEEVSMDYNGGATHRLVGVPALLRVQATRSPLCGGPDTCCLPR